MPLSELQTKKITFIFLLGNLDITTTDFCCSHTSAKQIKLHLEKVRGIKIAGEKKEELLKTFPNTAF